MITVIAIGALVWLVCVLWMLGMCRSAAIGDRWLAWQQGRYADQDEDRAA